MRGRRPLPVNAGTRTCIFSGLSHLSGLQDPFGVNYTMNEIYLAQQGGGFIYHHYPNPAHNMALEPKMSYVRKVDETWWHGAGIYLS